MYEKRKSKNREKNNDNKSLKMYDLVIFAED
jgi:hypothetical protein